ncbi:hypothetical protein [Comamonas antarctica]|uniref:hypothetical protein n=1 Tax=Comamonas antarctica TaxID=2743470 RepID=UPI0028E6825C|nr:hypothetical protein [Comamonas antarctica]
MSTRAFTHLAAAGAAALAVWLFQDARLGADLAEAKLDATTYQLDVSQAQRAADARVRAVEQAVNTKYQGALNASIERAALLRTELDHLRAVSDGLREHAADAARRLAAAPPTAVFEYALAANAVFDDCRAAYEEMVERADGHASDVRTLREAWPVIPTIPKENP